MISYNPAAEDDPNRPFAVGIGSSAGGIEALSQLVAALPVNNKVFYVVAQHLSPNHKSRLVEILARETELEVKEAEHGMQPKTDIIYIAPPKVHVTLEQGHFVLSTQPADISPKPSVNLLMDSLANEFGDHSIGVILSGTGSDGALGLKAIRAAGGAVLIQSPNSAKYEGMPKAAMQALEESNTMPPSEMGPEIGQLTNSLFRPTGQGQSSHGEKFIAELYELIQKETRIDFSSYKRSTILRRLQRRMNTLRIDTETEYLSYLRDNSDEVHTLKREILISVTDFFRDVESFQALRNIFATIVDRKQENGEIRMWVAGCATGEEAYSIAILLSEVIEQSGKSLKMQIFATDVDEAALAKGRRGRYPSHALEALADSLKEKFFTYKDNYFSISKRIREAVTFSVQDVTKDTPFVHLDLISCRNLLIYFNSELQAKVMNVFRYALRDDGYLFLGKSESIGSENELFATVNRRARIFAVEATSQRPHHLKVIRNHFVESKRPKSDATIHEDLFNRALRIQSGPSLLIDGFYNILFTAGNPYPLLNFPANATELNVSRLIVPELAAELISTINRAKKNQQPTQSGVRAIPRDQDQQWRLTITPLIEKEGDFFLVTFQKPPVEATTTEKAAAAHDRDLDFGELINAREQLQSLTEEMAASSEEMQALNEEIQATNEELQANNEELEAVNEELQATNEELVTSNEEISRKTRELADANSELEGVYNTIGLPLLVFDESAKLKRANREANQLFNLSSELYDEPLERLKLPNYFLQAQSKMQEAMRSGQRQSLKIDTETNQSVQLQIAPILDIKKNHQGTVIAMIDNTELIKAQQQIARSQEQLLSIMDNSITLVALKDTAGRYEYVNMRFEEVTGFSNDHVIGKTDLQLFGADNAKFLRDKDLDVMRNLSPTESIDKIAIEKGTLTLQSVRFPIFDRDGAVQFICTQANDITQARHANEQLSLAGKVFDRAGESILITNASGEIQTANHAFTETSGYRLEEVIGKNPRILASGKHSDTYFSQFWNALLQKGHWQGEIINKKKSGEIYREWLTVNSVRDGNGDITNYVATFSNINEIKNIQRKIEFLATHDELTKLPNRNTLIERLQLSINQSKRKRSQFALLFIDLDNFKNINDTLGHHIGDALLKKTTSRLQQCIRDIDMLARLGGDEFVTLLADTTIDEVHMISQRIIQEINRPFMIQDHSLFVTASIGISVFPDDGTDSVSLLKNADTAMYSSKEAGKNQYHFFTENMKDQAVSKMKIEAGLRKALEENQLYLVFQPKVDVYTGSMIGAEALIRWESPEEGKMYPAVFIPVAEKSQLIDKIGLFVFESALTNISKWLRKGYQVPQISINVSPRQLRQNDFVSQVRQLLKSFNVPAEYLALEITENALVENMASAREMLTEISKMGIGISIDDFGVGYSSLSYLRQLPINELKVDRKFVDGLVNEPDDKAITRTIITMAHALGLKVVAEGVESEQQLQLLREEHCEIVQGNLFHLPMITLEFEKLLTKSS